MGKLRTKTEKEKYKIKNWSSYNKSLENRGNINIWLCETAIKKWYDDGPFQQGAQYEYSDSCIEFMLTLKVVFNLPYRQVRGFAISLFRFAGIDLKVPSYSQICRRVRSLEIDLDLPRKRNGIYLVMDSTGLKVYGEGEWKVRTHGYSKRRTWRKLHLAVDEKTNLIHAQSLTENNVDDAGQLVPLLDQVKQKVNKVGADGAYDKEKCWDSLVERKIEGIIPPREDAVYWLGINGEILDYPRNNIITEIDATSKKEWKISSGYHRRSLSETAMMRFKVIFGSSLFSRKIESQKSEATIKIKALNKMTALGMPISERIN